MERLTEWNDEQPRHAYYPRCFEEPCYGSGCKIKDCQFETAACDRLAAYEDTGLTPERCAEFARADAEGRYIIMRDAEQEGVARLRELAEADKEGRVIVLPCKRGDELWTYCNYQVKRVYSFTVSDVSTLTGRTVLNTIGLGTIRPKDIGKTVFLTREEAEKALAERKGMKE